MENLSTLTEKALDRLGEGFEQNRVQREYAQHVAQTLSSSPDKENNAAIGLLEAETGVGKTLGYLIPLLLRQAMTDERVAVSTYTLNLQSQIMQSGGDMETALGAVSRALDRDYDPCVRVRKGLANFVSKERVKLLCNAFKRVHGGELPEDLAAFCSWAQNTPMGDLQEWIDLHGALPQGVTQQQVALAASDPEKSKADYHANVEEAKTADVVVMNHHVALSHSISYFRMLDAEAPLKCVVFDEADKLPDAARSMSANSLSLSSLHETMRSIHKEIQGARKALDVLKALWDRWSKLGTGGSFEYLSGRFGENVRDELKRLMSQLSRATPKNPLKFDGKRQQELVAEMRDKIGALDNLISAIESPRSNAVPLMRWSPTRRYPSIQVVPIQPGRAIKPYLGTFQNPAYLDAAVLTSATLGTSNSTAGMAAPFGLFPKHHNIVACESFEPTQFGHLEFVLAGSGFPHPSESTGDEEDPVRINQEWYDATARMIREAHGQGGRTLVLTPSYNDVNEFAHRLSDLDSGALLAQERGTKLRSLLPRFRETENAVLITPTGWEGLDLPGLIDNLVIARVPFVRPDDVYHRVMRKHFMEGCNMSGLEADKRVSAMDKLQTVNRLRQGIGRALRKPDSRATVWIADPRFPWPAGRLKEGRSGPATKQHSILLKSIPKRFQEGIEGSPWERARLFDLESEPA